MGQFELERYEKYCRELKCEVTERCPLHLVARKIDLGQNNFSRLVGAEDKLAMFVSSPSSHLFHKAK